MSLNDLQVLFHAKLLTSSVLTPTQSALLAILNNQPSSSQSQLDPSPVLTRLDSIDLQMMYLHQRVALVEQSCRPSAFSSSQRRHDDPDSEDHHEGEKQGSLNAEKNVVSGKEQEKVQSFRSASGGGSPNDENDSEEFEDDVVYPSYEPLNIIDPPLMIEYNKDEDKFPQNISMATEDEGMTSYITVDSDDEEPNVDGLQFKEVKEEEEEEVEKVVRVEVGQGEVNFEKEAVIEQFEDIETMFRTPPSKPTEVPTQEVPDLPANFGRLFDEEGEEINEEIFDRIRPPNEAVLENLQKEVDKSPKSKKKKKYSEGRFFKSKLVQLDLKHQQLRSILRQPFIEEQAWKIYEKEDFKPFKFNIIASYLFKQDDDLVSEYQTLMRRMMIDDENNLQEQRKFRIKNVAKIDCQKLARVIVPRFHVHRMNNQRYLFSEADFHILPLHDLMYIYDYLSNAIIKPWELQIASDVVKRYMKALIETSAFQDFQLGLEAVKRKINITMPNQTLTDYDLETIPVCMVFETPVKGFVLKNGRGMKVFIRLAELHKYSDGTLNLAYDCFQTLLDSKEAINEQIPLIKDAMKKIKDRIILRKQVRQVEICRGVRKRMFYKGSQFIEGYNPKKRKEPFDPFGPYLPNDPRLKEPKPED